MNPDLDPTDGMISRSALAGEVLVFRMKQLSENIYSASWLHDLEFRVWDMAFGGENTFGGIAVTGRMAKLFRDLATLADGWWVWPDTVGEDGSDAIFIPMERWKECLARRSDRKPSP
jgi:hypothetical protein